MQADEGVPGSRCFVVCGKAITSEELQAAFEPYGEVQSVKVVREKGVAYVKFDKASAAALAIESLNGAVLNNGRGPKLKVLLAEAPSSRGMPQKPHGTPELELSSDPDNVPPRSRLFIVVPKLCEPQQIQDDLGQFADIEYCKTDLAPTRGVVFCKFSKSSAALKALEAISERGNKVAGYTVKAMLAEPKTKRTRPDAMPPQDLMYGMQQARLDYGALNGMDPLKLQMGAGLAGAHMGMGLHDFAAIGGLSGLGAAGISSFSALASNMNNMNNMNNLQDMGHLGAAQGLALMGNIGQHAQHAVSPVSPNNLAGVPLSKQRLFVVVHKGVTEDAIARLFRRFPGMEYCDLKKERTTGKSKGYCYINYSTPDAAANAVEQLNGIEFPPHSGHRIKVMFAEPMGVRSSGSSNGGGPTGSVSMGGPTTATSAPTPTIMPSSVHSSATSLPSRSPGVLSMHGGSMQASTPSAQHTPLSRSMGGTGGAVDHHHHDPAAAATAAAAAAAAAAGHLERAAAAHLTSPVAPAVARELMFNVS